MTTGFNPSAMRAKLDALREILPEEKIFLATADGRPVLSPLAAQKLAEMDLKTAADWRDEHRDEASKLAAEMIEACQGDNNPPILLKGSRCQCEWTPKEMEVSK